MARQFVVDDTETTGLERAQVDLSLPAGMRARGDEVCQIGGLFLNEQMQPIRFFCHYCDTVAANVSPGAARVNHLDMEVLRKYVRCQYLPVVIEKWLPQFLADDLILIGYNVDFDNTLVKQTLSNSDMEFTWTPLRSSIVPRQGRHSVDVAEFFKVSGDASRNKKGYYRKLSSFESELEGPRQEFIQEWGSVPMDTNCIDLLKESWASAHNAFFDALNTYLLWRDRIWRKKLV